MERKADGDTFSLVLKLALKTLFYSVVFGALVFVIIIASFPGVAEDFYSAAGSVKLAYQFAERATGADASAARLMKTADKAVALMETDKEYASDAEYYCRRLLESGDAAAIFAETDKKNMLSAPREWHVNLCDSADYYASALYRARLARGITDFYIAGNDISPGSLNDYVSQADPASKQAAYLVGQASLYVQSCGEEGARLLRNGGFIEYYAQGLAAAVSGLGDAVPDIELLFRLKAFYRFYNAYPDKSGDLGRVEGFDGCENIKQLYERCFEKYCENK